MKWLIVPPTSSRRGLTVGLLTCVTAVAFEGMAVVTAMPAAAADLGDLHLYAWAFTAVMIAQLVSIVVAGRLADAVGPVKPLLAGLVVFAVGVVVAALAPTMLVLVVGRFIQGLGGGAIALTLMVVTAVAYDPAERARVMTWYSACWMLPSFIGPAIAAWLSENLSWHWVFWAVLPFVAAGAALMAPGLAHLSSRPTPTPDAAGSAAPVPTHAAVLVAGGIALLQVAGQRLEPLSLVWLAGGVVVLAVWFGRLMPHGFALAASGLSAVALVRLLVSGAFFGAQSFLPLQLSSSGVPLQVAGLAITVGSVGWMIGSWLQARPWLRLSRDQIIIAGAACVALGIGVLALGAWGGSDATATAVLVAAVTGMTLAGVGMGLQSSSTALATMQLSPESQIGRNTSSLQVGETTGNALFAGAAGTLFAALNPTSPDAVTFGSLLTLLAVGAGVGALVALRIGRVQNMSLRP